MLAHLTIFSEALVSYMIEANLFPSQSLYLLQTENRKNQSHDLKIASDLLIPDSLKLFLHQSCLPMIILILPSAMQILATKSPAKTIVDELMAKNSSVKRSSWNKKERTKK